MTPKQVTPLWFLNIASYGSGIWKVVQANFRYMSWGNYFIANCNRVHTWVDYILTAISYVKPMWRALARDGFGCVVVAGVSANQNRESDSRANHNAVCWVLGSLRRVSSVGRFWLVDDVNKEQMNIARRNLQNLLLIWKRIFAHHATEIFYREVFIYFEIYQIHNNLNFWNQIFVW